MYAGQNFYKTNPLPRRIYITSHQNGVTIIDSQKDKANDQAFFEVILKSSGVVFNDKSREVEMRYVIEKRIAAIDLLRSCYYVPPTPKIRQANQPVQLITSILAPV